MQSARAVGGCVPEKNGRIPVIFKQLAATLIRLFSDNHHQSLILSLDPKAFMLKRHLRNPFFTLALSFAMIAGLAACDDNNITSVSYHDIGPFDLSSADRFETEEGLVIYEHQEGDGEPIVENQSIRIRYTGRTADGEIFDSSYRNELDSPTTMRFSNDGSLIKGFFQGVVGVYIDDEWVYRAREGSQRTLVIPPHLGYGNSSTHALRNDTLTFDIEIIAYATDD